ncbi:hypothetical protein EI94DRAFT_1797014 [Lactarius quietus]|nr:hypothetical protein EI94DRAFT_1797014 [Lactarius quietus]
MDIHHLPPQRLSSESTLAGWTLYPEQVFAFDYAGASYLSPHHVNGERRHDYQSDSERIQYRHSQDTYYVPAQSETPQHSDLPLADGVISYWPTAQVPATDPVSSTTSMEPSDHFPSQWYYGNHDLSSTDHVTPVNQFQSISHGDSAESYRGAGYPDVSPLTAITAPSQATAIPAFAPLPTIAPHQSGSGHDLMPQDATAHSALCEGAATFQTTDTSYAQIGPYDNETSGEEYPQYATALAQEEEQPEQPYEAAYAPAAQDQYVAPLAPEAPAAPPAPVQAPTPGPPPVRMKRKASSQSVDTRSRGRSPMGHLPYDDIAKARKSRRSSVFSGFSSSPSSTPRPRSPVMQTLTFIRYPDLEPKGHGRGGECDGHGEDDDDGSPRRGRRGKKQPKKEPFLACYFCRGRKIACHPKNDGGEDKTCT